MQFNSPDNQRTESQVYTPPVYMRQQGPVRYGVDSHILSSQQSSPQQSHQVYTPSYPQLHYPVANAYGHGGARQSYGGGGFFAFGGPGPDYRPSMRSPRGFGGRGRFTRPASQNKGSHSDSVDAIHHYCDVCKVSCIGKQSYDAHLAGQKHKKKALQQSNDLLDCPSTLYYCEICKVSCFGREPYDAHLCGQKHKRNATALMSGKVISADEMAAEYFCEVCSIACRGKCSFDAHLVGSKHLKKLRATASNPSEYRCELCQVDCRTQAFYHLHLNGPRHKDNIARQERGETPLISYVCEVCDVDCTSQIPYEMHLTGQKHKTNLAKLEKGEASLQAFVCDICNMDCRSEASYASHLDGQKHRKNQAKLLNNGLSSYLSEVCDIGCGNQGLYDNLLIDQTFVGGASGSERGDTGVYLYDEWEPGYCSQESYESQMCSHTHRTDEPRLVYPESFVPFTANYDCTAHMGGQKHLESVNWKAQGESGENALSSVKTNELSCPLCNIKCTGVDTYKTHLTGRQHQRAVKLQTELGKAIPDCDAVAINAEKAAAAAASSQSAHAKKKRSSNSARIDSTDVDASISDDCIEEVKNGKSSVFCCRVCDCNFSDVNAKSLHLKGKKHQSALRKLRGAGDSVATTSTSGRPQVRQLSPAAAVARAAMPPPLPQQSFFGNPRIPGQTSSRFFRPLAVFVPPGQQAQQIGLPSHMLADERYMQTKLREILPSEQENSIMKLAVASVESALGRILRAQASDDERNQPRRGTRLPKGAEGFEAVIGQRDVDGVKVQAPTHDSVRPLSGVFRVGALASGLLLRGQHTAEMVLVLEKLPPAHYLTEVAEELEELLKESCKDHVVIVATIDGALVVHVTPSTLKESASASTAGAAPIAVSVRVRLTSTQILGNKAKAELKRADGGDADSDHADAHLDDLDDDDGGDDDDRVRKALLCSGLSKELCIDALTDVRRALWLQDALAQHPAVGNVVNVARVFSSLIRESQPCQWGKIPDYVLLVLLERLSFMDLPPVFQGGPPKLRAGLLLRRFLESLSAGILMSPGGELHTLRDPSTITHTLPFPEARLLPVTPLLADMSPEDREKATFAAQTCLRLVSFRQIFKVLNVPKFIPTPQRSSSSDVPKNGVAAKRKSTVENASLDDDDDDEDGVVGVCPSSDGQPIPMAGSSLAS